MPIFWKYITKINLNMPYVGIFIKHALYALYFCKPEQDNA